MRLSLRRGVRPLALALAILSCRGGDALGPGEQALLPSFDVGGGGSLIITEFIADPSGTDTNGEWFEVYNAGTVDVDLLGYRIASGPSVVTPTRPPTEAHTIASSVIVGPGEYIVIGNNGSTSANGGVVQAYSYPGTGTGSIVFNNSNTDWLTLKMPDGTLVDSVAYSVSTVSGTTRTITSPAFTPGASASRALIDLSADNTIAATSAWANAVSAYGSGASRGTPGQPNTGGPAATISVRISWVTPGTSFTITASAFDADAKPTFATLSWSVNDPGVATIDAVTGRATGVSTGVATVTATAANGVAGSAPLFVVNPGDVASVSLSMNDPRQVPPGYTKPIFPTVSTTTNPNVTTTTKLVWTSSNDLIATVSDLGYVTGVAPGKATIKATAPNGVYNTVDVTVIPAEGRTIPAYGNHLEFGTPRDANGDDDFLIADRRQYALSYNKNRGGPNWVSAHINASHFGAAPRCDCFSTDLALPAEFPRIVDFDYRNGGYDRGHMMQSEPRTVTDQENASTFLLSNILPQGAENNQGPWAKLENHLNDLARQQGKEVWVIMGGEFAETPGTLKGEGKVAIPDYTWKVAVITDGGRGLADVHSVSDLQVIAVRMPNLTTPGVPASSVGMRDSTWQKYETTVDDIEKRTGYNVLDLLPDQIEILVEAKDRPPVAKAGGPYTSNEGSSVTLDGRESSDPDGDGLTYAWDFGDGATGTGAQPTHTYADNGNYLVTLTVSDPVGATHTATSSVTVANVAPAISGLDVPAGPWRAGREVTVNAAFGDPGADTYTASVTWGDGSSSPALVSGGQVSAGHVYAAPGFYTISVVVSDDDGGTDTESATSALIVYDAAAGFVTGGGWYLAQGAAAGGKRAANAKANLSFVARYQGENEAPDGNVEFQLQEGGLAFRADHLEWLVAQGGRSTFAGTGTLAGQSGTYRFRLTAVDGDVAGGADRVRFRISNAVTGAVVYDNQPGEPELSAAATELGGGSIVAHQ